MIKTKRKYQVKEHLIFKTYGFYTDEELQDFVNAENENRMEGEEKDTIESLSDCICEDINLFYNDEKENLNKTLDNNIICIASMGLWNGKKSGYKIIGNNLNDVIASFSCDEYKINTDNYNIKFEGYHHDGTNYIEFREIRNSDNIDNLCNKIYNNEEISRSLLNYYTKPMGHYIKGIYGY